MSSAPLGSVLTRMLLCLHPLLFGPAHSPLASQGLGPHLLVPLLPHHRVPGAACLQGPAPPCPRGRGAQRGPCHHCSTGQPDAWVLLAPSWREWGAAALLVPPSSISVNPGSESLGGRSNISQHLRLRNRRRRPQLSGNLGGNERSNPGPQRQQSLVWVGGGDRTCHSRLQCHVHPLLESLPWVTFGACVLVCFLLGFGNDLRY